MSRKYARNDLNPNLRMDASRIFISFTYLNLNYDLMKTGSIKFSTLDKKEIKNSKSVSLIHFKTLISANYLKYVSHPIQDSGKMENQCREANNQI
ncbi:hypothetical protein BpHYR1_044725 [Brachionus plicatilis]|uniref:Uncharacterized protein n=1 Tax=Brachionus plicatilis TaxID=10195 RepID=A0A3M7QSG5_BRAPC|nr:hypothetical protein BpHYR1_044725 [Brachionus plicatilis]